ncbi:signal peptidase I [Lysinibacter sp. HNR]|uniref:signal peptidase I n=1 Tax=Lysinibacter sp. HNR TaxID=3031408 RepID=UPI0024359B26|nr:signal peptidase I [Lysinibacter sp. HNR]WGD36800.1 signal peptidase I [Lysinibacter sp. HNR]
MRALSFFRSFFLTLMAIIGGFCLLFFLVALILNIRPAIVATGSMAPAIPTGSLILTQKTAANDINVGDIVTTPRLDHSGLVTHRVVETSTAAGETTLILRGDANDINDPRPYTVTEVWRTILVIPYLGSLTALLQTPLGLITSALLIGLVLLLFFLPQHNRTRAQHTEETPRVSVLTNKDFSPQ